MNKLQRLLVDQNLRRGGQLLSWEALLRRIGQHAGAEVPVLYITPSGECRRERARICIAHSHIRVSGTTLSLPLSCEDVVAIFQMHTAHTDTIILYLRTLETLVLMCD